MNSPGWFSLIVLRQFLMAAGRLMAILVKSRPQKGFPVLTACLDVMERVAEGQHPEMVAVAVREFIGAIEDRCPGVIRALFPGPRHPRDLHHGDCLGPAAEETAEGVD